MTKGAAGLCIISADFPKKTATPTTGNMYTKANTAKGFAMLSISKEVATAILGTSNYTKGSFATQINLVATKTTENLESSNVVGYIPGTDKKDEYLVLSAHYDHLGKKGEVIWYGADDDGSGTVSVMQMAETFAQAARKGKGPRRSVVFAIVS